MAVFNYKESGKYFSLLVKDIKSGNAVKLGASGTGFTSKRPAFTSPKSVKFNKKKFGKIENLSGDELIKKLKTKNNDYFTDENNNTYTFTQIFKGSYSGQVANINTAQQEQITLKIIEEVLSDKTPHYKTLDEMFTDTKSGMQKIFKRESMSDEWWKHFELQFNTINDVKDFPSAKYDVFSYTDFMDFITKIVTVDNKWYSKKDSWNPADIWLIKSGKLKKYTDEISDATYVSEVNKILRVAYNNRDICGISLKKSNLTELRFEEVNLESNAKDLKLPDVVVDDIKLDCTFKDGQFTSKTSYLFVKEGTAGFKLAYKSNTGDTNLGNITYEFLATSGASAFLGKVPKDRLKKMIKTFIGKDGASSAKKMPQHQFLPKKWSYRVKRVWDKKVSIIKSQFPKYDIKELDKFVENLEEAYTKDKGITPNTATIMQMVEFTYILAMMQKKSGNVLQEFATSCFYFAQKKGQKYDFGPFGKLY
jgi:hypothetical protein